MEHAIDALPDYVEKLKQIPSLFRSVTELKSVCSLIKQKEELRVMKEEFRKFQEHGIIELIERERACSDEIGRLNALCSGLQLKLKSELARRPTSQFSP